MAVRLNLIGILLMVMAFLSTTTIPSFVTNSSKNVKADAIVYHGLKGDYYTIANTTYYELSTLIGTYADDNINFYPDFNPMLTTRTGRNSDCGWSWWQSCWRRVKSATRML